MANDGIKLLKSGNDYLFFTIVLLVIFIFNIFYEYAKYKDITNEEVYKTKALVLNLYEKDSKTILKLQDNNNTFYTRVENVYNIKKLDMVEILYISKYLTFYDYLKGFFVNNIYLEPLKDKAAIRYKIAKEIEQSHNTSIIVELFQALFLGYPISKELREVCTSFGISHLIAISGFHLGVLSLCCYFLFNLFYSPIHQNYFNYRNKKFDILVCTTLVLYGYLLLTNIIPSLLRSFVMFLLGIFFLRSNIKILSFNTLFITLLIILALFPKYIFSLGLWFSIAGVFYIYLFANYFKSFPKWFIFIVFNFWIFFALNPIIHYFFNTSSIMQLLSPLITISFTALYPVELFLHLIGQGDFFDRYLLWFFKLKVQNFTFETSIEFLFLYLAVSFLSIFRKEGFWLLNIMFVGFNIYLYT